MKWLAILVMTLLLVVGVASTATAVVLHVPDGSFGVPGKGIGELESPVGVGVVDASHDVFVADRDNHRVTVFNENGSSMLCEITEASAAKPFIEPTAVAVDNSGSAVDPSNEDVYVVDSGRGLIAKLRVNAITSTCENLGVIEGFEAGDAAPKSIVGIAVDPKGALWIATRHGEVYGFTDEASNPPNGKEVPATTGALSSGLGVDSGGEFYVDAGGGTFIKENELGELLENPVGGNTEARSIAVETPAKRPTEIYLASRESVSDYGTDGNRIESFGAGQFTFIGGVAVDSSDSMVYVTDQASDEVRRYRGVTLPSVATTSASEQSPTATTLNGSVNPEGGAVLACRFEYETTQGFSVGKKYGHSVNCLPTNLGTGSSPVPVHARVTGLIPETEYVYRLVAENEAPVPAETSQTDFFAGPLLSGVSTLGVSNEAATMRAEVDPNGDDTHYFFEYGTTATYGSTAPIASPGKDIGSTVGNQTVEARVQGLQPGALYHYRLVVGQAGETFEEPSSDHTFTTQRSGETIGADDGRSWELVSPAQKQGAGLELFEQGGDVQAAAGGDGLAYLVSGKNLGQNPQGRVTLSQDLSERVAPGQWETKDLTLPGRLPENEEPAVAITSFQLEYRLFSPDLGSSLVEPQEAGTPLLSPEASEQTLYLRSLQGSFDPLVNSENVVGGPIDEQLNFSVQPAEWTMHVIAVTPDLHHVLFKTPMALTAEAIDEEKVAGNKYVASKVQDNLYEWSGGQLQLINVLPRTENAKKEIVEEVAHGPYPTYPAVRIAGTTNSAGRVRGGAPRSMSNDGRWVAWAWGQPYTDEGAKEYRGLFLRDMQEHMTRRLGGASATYQAMNADGSKVFYMEHGDLYEFDTATDIATDLTGGAGAEVQEPVSEVSEDGDYIYFVAKGVLATGAQAGEDNLYLLHDLEGTWTTTYVTTLASADEASWRALEPFGAPFLAGITARVSPDGRFFTFMSDQELTGYDNRDAVSGARDEEIFLYDADTERIACVSCDPTGARPHGLLDTSTGEIKLIDREQAWTSHGGHWIAAILPSWDNLSNDPATYQPRFLSNEGRMFFDSVDAIVPQDTNGLSDVYEFEPIGVGGCVEGGDGYVEAANGCVSLISSGTARSESAYYDSSESGDDVFFDTTAKLVGQDFDAGYDVYDAHVCSSEAPCPVYPEQPSPCVSGAECKGAPTPQPELFGAPPSATFNGIGNVAPVSPPTAKPKQKSLTNAQKLAAAIKACRKKRPAARRAKCERQARRRYPVKQSKGKTLAGKGRGRA